MVGVYGCLQLAVRLSAPSKGVIHYYHLRASTCPMALLAGADLAAGVDRQAELPALLADRQAPLLLTTHRRLLPIPSNQTTTK